MSYSVKVILQLSLFYGHKQPVQLLKREPSTKELLSLVWENISRLQFNLGVCNGEMKKKIKKGFFPLFLYKLLKTRNKIKTRWHFLKLKMKTEKTFSQTKQTLRIYKLIMVNLNEKGPCVLCDLPATESSNSKWYYDLGSDATKFLTYLIGHAYEVIQWNVWIFKRREAQKEIQIETTLKWVFANLLVYSKTN